MIQQQIDNFSRSLQNLATEYSDPAIIVQHIPVLKDNLMLQQNPEYVLYGLGGLLVSLFALKRLRKRRKAQVKNVGLVMPQPYLGEADPLETLETAPASYETTIPTAEELTTLDASPISESSPVAKPALTRTTEQQLEDVSVISFMPRAALTPDEARMRVLVQASVNEFGGGYMIMARTSLAALLQPGREAVGLERANALSAIQDKYVDFGVFDRAGRCLVALEVNAQEPTLGNKLLEKAVVAQALSKAGVHMITLDTSDTPALVGQKIAPYLKAVSRPVTAPMQPVRASVRPKKAPRSGRPQRPTRPAAIAAE